jgi:hypothetical protein
VSLDLSSLLTSAFILSTATLGMPLGAIRPCQIGTSYPLTPDSARVGTFGSAGSLLAVVTARARSRPALTCGSAVAVLVQKRSVCRR